jgi:hypothetical protein
MSVNQQDESFTKFEEDRFEEELTQAMRTVDPPEGFAERVMARAKADAKPRARVLGMPLRARVWASGAIAAALLVGVFIGDEIHVRRQREQAEQQFEAGIRITDRAIEHTREQLQRAGIQLGN